MRRAIVIAIISFVAIALFVLPFHAYFYLIPCELRTDDSLLNAIGIFISYYTLLATIFVAFSIYWLQMKSARRERAALTSQAKAAMLLELEDALELCFFAPEGNRRVAACEGSKEALNSNASELSKALTSEEFLLLKRMVNAIHKRDDREISQFLRDWV